MIKSHVLQSEISDSHSLLGKPPKGILGANCSMPFFISSTACGWKNHGSIYLTTGNKWWGTTGFWNWRSLKPWVWILKRSNLDDLGVPPILGNFHMPLDVPTWRDRWPTSLFHALSWPGFPVADDLHWEHNPPHKKKVNHWIQLS